MDDLTPTQADIQAANEGYKKGLDEPLLVPLFSFK
jgi:hypothetical protein